MTYTVRALQRRPGIEQASQSLEDAVALTAVELFPQWGQLVKEKRTHEKGVRIQHEAKIYLTYQKTYKFEDHNVPGTAGTESLFSVVDETHKGTKEDPIPYDKNMEIYNGLYYIQYDVLYLCIRDSGQPLYHDLSALVGSYVEVVL